jgi:hypothetical protein
MSSWGRGTYGQRGSAVEQVLAQIAEQAKRDEDRERQEAFAREQSSRAMQAELLSSYMKNPNEQTYAAMMQSGMMGGVNVPQYEAPPDVQYRRKMAGDALSAFENDQTFRGLAPGGLQAGRYQMAFDAPAPTAVAESGVSQAVYGNQQALPAEVVQAQKVNDKLLMNADEQEKARQWGEEFTRIKLPESSWKNKLTGAQIGEANAQAGAHGAQAGLYRAQTGKANAETANAKGEADPTSPLFKGKPPGSDYKDASKGRILDSVRDLSVRTSPKTVGPLGVAGARIAGTDAYNYNADLDTLKSNIAFSALQEMREASKTGGALGQVSDKETALLQSTLGALKQGQSPANMKRNLKKIEDSLARWENAKSGGAGADPVQAVADKFFGGDRVKAEAYLKANGR